MSVHVFNSGVQHKWQVVDVETRVRIDPAFWKLWMDWYPGSKTHPGRLASEVVAFVCRAGGPSSLPLTIRLRSNANLTRRPFCGDHYRGFINVWVSPKKDNPSWGEFRHYKSRPLLPAYAVCNPREAVVAAVAHESCHWLGIGRHPDKYWRDDQALAGTEFICEAMATVCLEVFCKKNPRLRKL